MKKTFKSYMGIWAISLALFNVIAFVSPIEMKGGFWAGYVFITLTFIGQLLCANIAFRAENAQKFFYNFPLISISFVGTLAMLLVGALTMAITAVPVWVGAIFCSLILGFSAISVINASVVSETVERVDVKIKTQTVFVRMLIADAETLVKKADTQDKKAITKKVYETIRYSDPVSSDALSSLEAQITIKFREFEKAVCENRENMVSVGEEVIILMQDRNTKCKIFK